MAGTHAHAEAMGFLATTIVGLKRPFHGYRPSDLGFDWYGLPGFRVDGPAGLRGATSTLFSRPRFRSGLPRVLLRSTTSRSRHTGKVLLGPCRRFLAERVGFEPTERFRDQRFSRPPRSTTPAPLLNLLRVAALRTWRDGRAQHDGGERGIRTLGRLSPTHTFQACSLNHSDISPGNSFKDPRGPPRGPAVTGTERTPGEEGLQQTTAFGLENSFAHFEAMVQPGILHQVAQRAAKAGLGVPARRKPASRFYC